MSTSDPPCGYHKMIRHRTIVILGETGVGKSNLINNVSLILQFPTLDEALAGAKDFTPPIPVRGEFKGVDISEGLDPNERNEEGQSRTLMPKVYRVQSSSYVFEIIDTPGISDSGGLEMDRQHVENITACLRQFKEIHAILIAFNSSHNTLTHSLKSTLNELLSCLGKTAAKQIKFIVTRVTHTMEMSDARGAIKAYLNSLQDNPGIEIGRSNMFGFEAASFQYFMASKKGLIEHSPWEKTYNCMVYENNRCELLRLFKGVHNCSEPYNVMNAKTLIVAKQMQPKLSSLLAALSQVGASNTMEELESKLLQWREKEIALNKQPSQERMEKLRNLSNVIWNNMTTLPGGTVTTTGIFGAFVKLKNFMPFVARKETVKGAAAAAGSLASLSTTTICSLLGVGVAVVGLVGYGAYRLSRSKFEKFKAEQSMLCNLLEDIDGYLEKHAIAMSDKQLRVSSEKRVLDSSFAQHSINNQPLHIADVQSNVPTPSTCGRCDNMRPEILYIRLYAMASLEYFGKDIATILSECIQLEDTQLTVVDIILEESNWFIQKLLSNDRSCAKDL